MIASLAVLLWAGGVVMIFRPLLRSRMHRALNAVRAEAARKAREDALLYPLTAVASKWSVDGYEQRAVDRFDVVDIVASSVVITLLWPVCLPAMLIVYQVVDELELDHDTTLNQRC